MPSAGRTQARSGHPRPPTPSRPRVSRPHRRGRANGRPEHNHRAHQQCRPHGTSGSAHCFDHSVEAKNPVTAQATTMSTAATTANRAIPRWRVGRLTDACPSRHRKNPSNDVPRPARLHTGWPRAGRTADHLQPLERADDDAEQRGAHCDPDGHPETRATSTDSGADSAKGSPMLVVMSASTAYRETETRRDEGSPSSPPGLSVDSPGTMAKELGLEES